MLLRCVDQAADTVVHVAATSAALLVEHARRAYACEGPDA